MSANKPTILTLFQVASIASRGDPVVTLQLVQHMLLAAAGPQTQAYGPPQHQAPSGRNFATSNYRSHGRG